MRLFVTTYMNDNFDVFGGLDGAQQRIYILVRKDGPVKNAADHQPVRTLTYVYVVSLESFFVSSRLVSSPRSGCSM